MVQAVTLTLAEAAAILDPPVTERQLRAIITALGWQPDGHRRNGRAGRPAPTYSATRLMELHTALLPFTSHCMVQCA
jgi:hypothetical protein